MTNTTNTTNTTDFLSLMESEARAVASAFGVRPAHDLAAALVDRMQHLLSGGSVYVPKRGAARKRQTHAAMRREYTGANLRDVAARHGYSEVQARRIVQQK